MQAASLDLGCQKESESETVVFACFLLGALHQDLMAQVILCLAKRGLVLTIKAQQQAGFMSKPS